MDRQINGRTVSRWNTALVLAIRLGYSLKLGQGLSESGD